MFAGDNQIPAMFVDCIVNIAYVLLHNGPRVIPAALQQYDAVPKDDEAESRQIRSGGIPCIQDPFIIMSHQEHPVLLLHPCFLIGATSLIKRHDPVVVVYSPTVDPKDGQRGLSTVARIRSVTEPLTLVILV